MRMVRVHVGACACWCVRMLVRACALAVAVLRLGLLEAGWKRRLLGDLVRA